MTQVSSIKTATPRAKKTRVVSIQRIAWSRLGGGALQALFRAPAQTGQMVEY